MGHNYGGHNYIGHNYEGHNYVGHNYMGHNYLCHNYIGHNPGSDLDTSSTRSDAEPGELQPVRTGSISSTSTLLANSDDVEHSRTF